jgi:hypothetical protein
VNCIGLVEFEMQNLPGVIVPVGIKLPDGVKQTPPLIKEEAVHPLFAIIPVNVPVLLVTHILEKHLDLVLNAVKFQQQF